VLCNSLSKIGLVRYGITLVENEKTGSKIFDFKSLSDFSNWKDYETFMLGIDSEMEHDLQKSVQYRKKLREDLLSCPEIREKIRPGPDEAEKWESLLTWAEKELFGGNVCAVDGSLSRYPMASGTRCRIGVVATSYRNNRVEKVLYVSEREFAEPSSTPYEHFNKLLESRRVSSMLLRALMLHCERQLALQRPGEWKFVHGELMPYELRTGLGVYRALDECLDLGRKLIETKKVIGVIEDTTRIDLLNAGDILERGEFMEISDLKTELGVYLYGDDEKGISGAHFSRGGEEKFKSFIDSFAKDIRVGMFRVGYKPYLIQAHKDTFDEAVALVMRDAMNQSMRGFPLLIDYADTICHRLFSEGEFQKQIMHKIAKISPEMLGFETIARMTRRR